MEGKRVVVYIDRVDISSYHWTSVADHLVLDPAGAIGLQGYVAGHTYFKDALDKLGIGFRRVAAFPVQVRDRSVRPPRHVREASANS